MAKNNDDFEKALQGKRIPILTLDNNWHRLFTQTEPTATISKLEEKINNKLKRQGKLNTELKEVRKIKKRLMDEIVDTMNDLGDKEPSEKISKRMNDNKRLIEECNQKIDDNNDELFDISKEINELNHELMMETMEVCYAQIQDNYKDIVAISKWIDQIRIDLKKNVVIKQQKMARNQSFYAYMHNIFGADVIDLFDMKYNVTPPPLKASKPETQADDSTQKEATDGKEQ